MSLVGGIVTYVLVWWLVLFTVLPWGNRPVEEPEPGHVPSAPAQPRLLLKFGVTTLVATLVFLAIFGVIEADWISFREG